MDYRPVLIALLCLVAMSSATFLPVGARLKEIAQPHHNSAIVLGGNAVYLWGRCINIPVLGNCCAEIFGETSNLTLTIALLINGNIVHTDVLAAGQICLTQDELLKLLTDIPALVPFKPLIDGLIELLKFIPAEVLSVCLNVYNVSNTPTTFSGCLELNTTLICWKDHCLYQGTDQFGCFSVPIPHLEAAPLKPALPASEGAKPVNNKNNKAKSERKQ